jgi:hypothetical protein
VGIGTASPSSRLHTYTASGGNKLTVEAGAASQQAVVSLVTNATTPGQCQLYMGKSGATTNGQVGYDPNSDYMYFYSNNTERMRIDSSGNVGIGTSSPSYKLQVNSTATTDGVYITNSSSDGTYIYLNNSSTNGRQYRFISTGAGNGPGAGTLGVFDNTANAYRTVIDSSGNLLVGATSAGGTGWSLYPSGYLITNGATSTFTHMSFQTSSSQKGYIQTVGATTNYNGSSDYRLKKNVIPLPNALQTIAQLKPVKFNWIEDDSVAYSFIAHELQEVVPQAVGGTKDEVDKNGKPVYQGIDQSKLVCFLTAAIQELKAINDTLTARIVALEAK